MSNSNPEKTAPEALLWPSGVPGPSESLETQWPSLTVHLPPGGKATGAAVVVCPGGGYQHLAPHEAEPVAQWLNTLGITAFVLRYRLAPSAHYPAMLDDATRAIRTVRARADTWGLDPSRIGILGFSAGGHLASLVTTCFSEGDPDSDDPVERVSSRPDASVLIYPVITMEDPYGHTGSRANLLGSDPDPRKVSELSTNLRVTPQTPPVFLAHSADDAAVPCENSLLMAEALRRNGVACDLHIYEKGGHGFGLAAEDPLVGTWTDVCGAWLRVRGFA